MTELEKRNELIKKIEYLKTEYNDTAFDPFTDEENEAIDKVLSLFKNVSVYVCDQKACTTCPSGECHHTFDVAHAVNFECINGYYVEKMNVKIDRSNCCQCIHNGTYGCINPEEISVDKESNCSGHTTILEEKK